MVKYYLLNKRIPCMASCGHIECLRKDLIHRGYFVKSLEPISEKRYNKLLRTLNVSQLSYTYYL